MIFKRHIFSSLHVNTLKRNMPNVDVFKVDCDINQWGLKIALEYMKNILV